MHLWEVVGRKPRANRVQENRLCKLCAIQIHSGICARLCKILAYRGAPAGLWRIRTIVEKGKTASGITTAAVIVYDSSPRWCRNSAASTDGQVKHDRIEPHRPCGQNHWLCERPFKGGRKGGVGAGVAINLACATDGLKAVF